MMCVRSAIDHQSETLPPLLVLVPANLLIALAYKVTQPELLAVAKSSAPHREERLFFFILGWVGNNND